MKLIGQLNRLGAYFYSHLFYAPRFYAWGYKAVLQKPDLLFQTHAIQLGDRVSIRKGARLETLGEWDGKKPKLVIGEGTAIQLYFHCGAAESVIIGKNVLIAGRVYISDHDHEIDDFERSPINSGLKIAPVKIEDEVWIGEGVAILKGVTIGKRAVIGANAVVTKDVPPYTVVGGIPARVIRTLTPPSKEN
ncbi:MAG: acyltransferase [Methylococcales bacterium]|nr:acyltransferase [Methylococcales bacterium]